ncbi:SMI1/KNR4 family protein [Hymenobacter negativus]|uniref:SMI1/KNR4 family protein n=1 Tax=Hymenobacter negativus TaxID=2795026 RepID=A0ABS3QPZ8_9BACT|nr:SMI1/KNR4 family protein [Hymenobacter negativus]MBO2013013.1 SMI1/KNR4 family protein [Hymenobacter negativus]
MRTFEYLSKEPRFVTVDTNCLLTHKLADGQSFPPSYLDFATQLGWGRLCGLLLVYVPLGQYPDSWLIQSPKIRQYMDDFYKEMEYDALFLEPDGYEGIEQYLLPFAMSENGEYLAWDTSRRDDAGEFPIYVLAARLGGIRYGAKDLYEFIEKCTDEAAVKTMFGTGYSALPPTFESLPLT